MRRDKYNFIKIDKNDYFDEFPDQWDENVDTTIKLIDELLYKVSQLELEVKRLKEAREWP